MIEKKPRNASESDYTLIKTQINSSQSSIPMKMDMDISPPTPTENEAFTCGGMESPEIMIQIKLVICKLMCYFS